MPEAKAALAPDEQVRVQVGKWLVFEPASGQATTGLVIYPGGRVDPAAYAPAAHALAAGGYTVVIVPMPLNLAVLNAGAAKDVIAAYPAIQHWAVGGHSLGGAMAANFAAKNPGTVQGLVLWAAYPAGSDDLSTSGIQVVSVYAEQDGLATLDQIEASRALLPPGTAWVSIRGGNHAGFGWYGDQPGDNPATITRQEQQRQVVEATRQLLVSLP
jgi:pimeloyl-ACP methyl ester carboxylesterase